MRRFLLLLAVGSGFLATTRAARASGRCFEAQFSPGCEGWCATCEDRTCAGDWCAVFFPSGSFVPSSTQDCAKIVPGATKVNPRTARCEPRPPPPPPSPSPLEKAAALQRMCAAIDGMGCYSCGGEYTVGECSCFLPG